MVSVTPFGAFSARLRGECLKSSPDVPWTASNCCESLGDGPDNGGIYVFTRRELTRCALGLLGASAVPPLVACGKSASVRLLGEDSSNLNAISAALPDFQKQEDLGVSVEATDFSTSIAKSTADFASGSGIYDIVLQYNFSLSSFVRNDYVLTIEDVRKAAPAIPFDFSDALLPNVWQELGYYAVKPYNDFNVIQPVAYPFAANTMILVYNRTVLSDARVAGAYQRMFGRSFSPALDWGEFVRAVNLVRSANPEFYGVALQGAAGGWLYYEWVNFLFGLGGRVMNKRYGWQSDLSTPLEIDSPEASRAAELYLSLRSANAGDFFATDAVKQRDIMLEGKTAFALMWTDYIPDLAARGDMFGFAPVPGTKSMIAGGCYFINKKTRSPERAAKLVSYLLSPAVQKFLALHGLFPPTRAALADVQVQAKPYMPAVRESLERGVYMAEAGPDADLISEQITNSMQRAWRGEIAPTDVGSSASRAIQDGRKQIK